MNNPYAVCRACGDEGQNSRGLPCHPCRVQGRLGARRYAVGRRCGAVFATTAGPSYDVNALRDYRPKSDATEYIVLLGDGPKPIARWKDGRWQKKSKKKMPMICRRCGVRMADGYDGHCAGCLPF